MPTGSDTRSSPSVGIIGFGAFGQLIARSIRPYFRLYAYDPAPGFKPIAERHSVTPASLEIAASRPVVVLATPVGRLAEVVDAVAPHIQPGSLVLDVGSVKLGPVAIMRRGLPEHAGMWRRILSGARAQVGLDECVVRAAGVEPAWA